MEKIRLIKGDCLEVMDKLIEEGVKVDAVITDLPYGLTACSWDSVIPFNNFIIENPNGKKSKVMYKDEWVMMKAMSSYESVNYWMDEFDRLSKEGMWQRLKKLIKPNGAIVLFGSESFSSVLRCSNLKMYKYDWYWIKTKPNGFQHSKNKPMTKVETISVFSKAPMGHLSLLGDKRMQYNPQGIYSIGNKIVKNCTHSGNTMGGANHKSSRPNQVGKEYEAYTNFPHNVLEYANIVGKNAVHPTQKPVELLEYLIKTYTSEGETVLDFTCGSGSTMVACDNTGRMGIGIDNGICNKKGDLFGKSWIEITQMRLNQARNDRKGQIFK